MDLYAAIAERLSEPDDGDDAEPMDVTPEQVEEELRHRSFPDDSFWIAWDRAVSDGAELVRAERAS